MATGKCPYCEAAFGKGSVFCKKCGKELPREGDREPPAPSLSDATLDECLEGLVVTAAYGDSTSDGTNVPELFDSSETEAPAIAEPTTSEPGYLLKVLNGGAAGRSLRLSEGITVVIGTSRNADVDVVLTDDCMSRRHATLRVMDGKLLVNDEGSTNGTFIRVGSVSRELQDGDCLFMGNTLLQVGKE